MSDVRIQMVFAMPLEQGGNSGLEPSDFLFLTSDVNYRFARRSAWTIVPCGSGLSPGLSSSRALAPTIDISRLDD